MGCSNSLPRTRGPPLSFRINPALDALEAVGHDSDSDPAHKDTIYKVMVKSPESQEIIVQGLVKHPLFVNMETAQLNSILGAMQRMRYPAGQYICLIADDSDSFFIIEEGECYVFVADEPARIGKAVSRRLNSSLGKTALNSRPKTVRMKKTLRAGDNFGDTFLFNAATRTASVQAKNSVVVWGITRQNYKSALQTIKNSQHAEVIAFLSEHTPLLRALKRSKLFEIAEKIDVVHLAKGVKILEQGGIASDFYVLRNGSVSVWKNYKDDLRLTRSDSLQPAGRSGGSFLTLDRMMNVRSVDLKRKSKIFNTAKAPEEKESLKELANFDHWNSPRGGGSMVKDLNVLPRRTSTRAEKDSAISSLETFARAKHVEEAKALAFDRSSADRSLVLPFTPRHSTITAKSTRMSAKAAARFNATEAPTLLACMSEGECFGERSLLTDEPITATVIADSDVTLYKIDYGTFMRHLSPLPDMMKRCLAYGILILKMLPLFQDLSRDQLDEISKCMESRKYIIGETIVEQGDESRTLFIVVSGEVNKYQKLTLPYSESWLPEKPTQIVTNTRIEGTDIMEVELLVATIREGEYFGDEGLLDRLKRVATAKAATDVICLCLGRDGFRKLLSWRSTEKSGDYKFSTPPSAAILPRSTSSPSDRLPVFKRVHEKDEMEFGKSTLDDYEVAPGMLGQGAFGQVRLTRHKRTQKLYAAKILTRVAMETQTKPQLLVEVMDKEVTAMLDIKPSPFISRIHNAFKDSMALYVITEVVRGMELSQKLREVDNMLDDIDQIFYAANVIIMLEHLHEQDVIYRDLKPENLCIDQEGYLKLIDFGFAKKVISRTYTLCGSAEYMAPEIIVCIGHDYLVDWWSMGVLLFEIATGTTPFKDRKAETPYQTYLNILQGKICNTIPRHMSVQCMDLINRLLQPNRSMRIGADGAATVKKHPWFKAVDWVALAQRTVDVPWIPGDLLAKKKLIGLNDSDWTPLRLGTDTKTGDWFDEVAWHHF